jgi:exonuclease SbcC
MRPLELRLRGFRSYRDDAVFDWRGRSLVGVVGPIGSGKSSLLDAVAFALYGKTPTFERDTKSLIHQLCGECHVELRFEVDGQVWRAVRALRRKGASGHQLWRLRDDGADASPIEEIAGEKPMRERVEQLLGMEFDAFCRSVMLAQNRFADFLRATPKARNEVLKGVFGYERFDAALEAAKRRVVMADAEVAAFALEGARLVEARAREEQARARLARATERVDELERSRAGIEAAEALRHEAAERAAETARTIAAIEDAAARLGTEPPDEVLLAAEEADASIERAMADADAAAAARRDAEAVYAAVSERVGDQAAFAALVQEHDHRAEAARAAANEAASCAEAVEAALAEARTTADEAAVAEEVDRAAGEALSAAEGEAAEADASLHAARHADMARALRVELVAGDPCPVCDRPVESVPKAGRAPAVAGAEKALARARAHVAAAQASAQASANAVGTARARLAAAGAKVEEAERARGAATERVRRTEAELVAVASQLVDRLGEGDPRALLEERRAELLEAEQARDAASGAESSARDALDEARRGAERAAAALAGLATRLATAWGALGAHRDDAITPEALRRSFIELGETVVTRRADADAERQAADGAVAEAHEEIQRLRGELGLAPDDDLTLVLAGAAAEQGAARQEVDDLVATIEAGADLADRLAGAEQARDLARRLCADLQPARLLAFLLEEERAALAALGSVHFDDLSNGAFRFTDDDRFDVLDLNAAATERRADSLSGGETFLASLALALALAEMVARGGGRLDAFFLDEGFGSLDPEHLDRAMEGIGHLVAGDAARLVVLVSHVAEMRDAIEDLIVLDKDPRTGDTVVVSGAAPAV